MATYQITAGDTLSKIAQANKTTVDALAKANNIADPNKIYAGASLTIPDQTINSTVLTPQPDLSSAVVSPSPTPVPIVPTNNNVDASGNLLPTQPETQASELSKRIQALNDQTVGQAAYRQQQEIAQGIPELTKTQNELSSQLTALTNEYKAIPLQLQQESTGRGITTGGLAPLQTARLRTNAIQALGVNSLLEASRGNLTLAQDLVDRAVAAKYDPIEEEIKAKTANLDLILKSPEYTLAEKNRAQAQKDIQDKKAADIVKKREDSTTIMSWAAAALANGATPLQAQQLTKIAQSDNPDLTAAFNLYAPFAKNPDEAKAAILELENKRLTNEKLKADIKKINNEIVNSGIPTITNPDAGKYAGALSVILGSQKLTKDQKASITNAINRGEDPFVVIKNQAREIMSGANKTDTEKYEVIQTQLEALQTLMSDYYASGGKTNIFSGNLEKTINKLGEVSDPALVGIATNIASSLQAYRNAISGTAYSEQEGKDIAAIFPGINKSEGLNKAIIAGRLQFVNTTLDGKYRSVLGSTYDSIKNANQPDTLVGDDGKLYVKQADGTYLEKNKTGTGGGSF